MRRHVFGSVIVSVLLATGVARADDVLHAATPTLDRPTIVSLGVMAARASETIRTAPAIAATPAVADATRRAQRSAAMLRSCSRSQLWVSLAGEDDRQADSQFATSNVRM